MCGRGTVCMMDGVVTQFALASVAAATVGFGGLAVFVTWLLGSGRGVPFGDKLVIVWCIYDAVTHFLLVSQGAKVIFLVPLLYNCCVRLYRKGRSCISHSLGL